MWGQRKGGIPLKGLLGEHPDWNCSPWPGTIVTTCTSCFTTGGPSKEHGEVPTRRVQERSKGDTTCPTTSQNPRWHPSWLSNECTTRKDSESEWLVRDNPETNPITTKPETTSHVAEQFSWVPLPYCSLPGCSFPIKISCCVRHVSLDNSFLSVRQEPTFWPGRGPPSCNRTIWP